MQESRKLYVIPGYGESVGFKNYKEIKKLAKESGVIVVPIKITWDQSKTMSEFIKEADEQIPTKIKNDYILGFSFGAYISAVLAKKKDASGYIFCSLSPYFKEDLRHIPIEASKYFGKRMMRDLSKFTFPKNIKSNAWFLIGTKEWPYAIQKTKKSYQQWAGEKKMYLIKNADHCIADKNYMKVIKKIIKKL